MVFDIIYQHTIELEHFESIRHFVEERLGFVLSELLLDQSCANVMVETKLIRIKSSLFYTVVHVVFVRWRSARLLCGYFFTCKLYKNIVRNLGICGRLSPVKQANCAC